MRRAAGIGAVAAAVFAVAYAPTFRWMADRWFAEGSTYGHGPLVAAIAVVAVGRQFLAGSTAGGAPARGALAALYAALAFHAAGLFLRIESISGFSIPVALYGACGAFGGAEALRRARPWLGFLVFAIPLPLKVLYDLSFLLKERSTDLAVGLSNVLGLGVGREGPTLTLRNGESLLVGDACSGIRSLVAFAALAYFYAFLLARGAFLRRAALVALSVPAAFLSNALRLLGLLVVATTWGTRRIEGLAHEIAAVPLYLGAFGGLLALAALLPGRAPPSRKREPAVPGPYRPALGACALALAAFGAVSAGLLAPRLWASPRHGGGKPELPMEIDGLLGADLPLTEREIALLGTRDVLYRRYAPPRGDSPAIHVAIVRGSGERHVVHPPDACYIGSGFDILERGRGTVRAPNGVVPLGMLDAVRAAERILCAYVYLSGPRATASYFRHQVDFLLDAMGGGGGRSLLLRLDTPVGPDETLAEARSRLEAFASRLVDPLRGAP